MGFRKIASGVMILAGLLLTFGTVQSATAAAQDRTNCDDTTCEVYWWMPGSVDGAVTWPQKLVTEGTLGCGRWFQIDRYPKDAIDTLVADGVLNYQEDWGIAISWRFEYSGDCPKPTSTYSTQPSQVPTPTETEETSSTPTPSTTPSSTPPTEPPATTPPTTGPITTPTVEPTTPVTHSSTPSTAVSPPTVSTAPGQPLVTDTSGSAKNTTTNRLADTGAANLSFLLPVGLIAIALGIIGFIWGRKPKTK